MKRVHTTQFRIVTGNSVAEYEDNLNKAIRELRDMKPEVEFHQSNPMFAYVRYQIYEEIAETLADEYELLGIKYTCWECKHIRGIEDKRRRYYWCSQSECVTARTPACDEFYKLMATGDDPRRFKEDDDEDDN